MRGSQHTDILPCVKKAYVPDRRSTSKYVNLCNYALLCVPTGAQKLSSIHSLHFAVFFVFALVRSQSDLFISPVSSQLPFCVALFSAAAYVFVLSASSSLANDPVGAHQLL